MARARNGNFGHGAHTEFKQETLGVLFDSMLPMFVSAMNKYSKFNDWRRFVYIDTNAGPGRYEGHIGSPLIFHQKMIPLIESGAQVDVHLIEKEPDFCRDLRMFVPDSFNVHCGDHNDLLPEIVSGLPDRCFGLLYHDPKGTVSRDAILRFYESRKTQKIDFLARIQGTSEKRVIAAQDKESLHSVVKSARKEAWVIQDPRVAPNINRAQWSFIWGINSRKIEYSYQRLGLYDTRTAKGAEVFDYVFMDRREYDRKYTCQLELFPAD